MGRTRIVLVALAITGWIGALLTQLKIVRTADDVTVSNLKITRNRFLLLSSITMNTVVLGSVYRFVKRR
ncbi:MAG: hypothetical protein ACOCY7_04810 [Halodesulfurarchaeum sp.]